MRSPKRRSKRPSGPYSRTLSEFAIVPFDFSIFQMTLKLPEGWEIHDRIIAATACYYGAKLVTRDEVLQTSDEIETVW